MKLRLSDTFEKSSLIPNFKEMKQLIEHPLDYFTEVLNDNVT